MKKLCKLLVTLVFCMGVLVTTLVPSFAADALSQVKSLKATATHNTVTLTWKKVSGAKGYEVQQYKNKKWVNLSAVVTSTTYKASKLTTGTTYKFRVRAYKTNFFGRKNGYGKYSATVSAKTVPGKVATVKVSATTATTATLKWSTGAGATGYYVQTYQNKKWVTKATTKADVKTYTIKGLALGKSYKYRVVPFAAAGKEKVQGAASATITVKPAVPAPSSLKYSGLKSSSVKLTWAKVADASGYYIKEYKDNKWVTVKTIKGNKTFSYTASIYPGKTFKYRVSAYKTVSGKTYQGKETATLSVKYTIKAPTNLKVTATASNSTTLSWKGASNIKTYQVQRYTNKKWVKVANVKGYTYKASTVPGTTYTYRVLAYLTVSSKAYYSTASNSIDSKYSVPAPSDLKAVSVEKDGVNLSWKAAKGVEGYRIQTLEDGKWTSVSKSAANTAKLPIVPNKAYSIRVLSYVTVNNKVYLSTATGTVEAAFNVGAPSDLKISSLSKDKTTLSFGAVNGASSYTVEVSTGGAYAVAGTATDTTFAYDTIPGTDYKFRVLANVVVGETTYKGAYSNEISSLYTVAAPSELKVTAGTKQSLTLAWTAAANADGYTVYSVVNGVNTEIAKTTATTFTVPNLAAATSYSFVVSAYQVVGENSYGSAMSNTVTGKTATVAVSGVNYSSIKETSAAIYWSAVPGAEGYTVYKLDGGKWIAFKTQTGTSLSLTGLGANTTYTFAVAAYHKANGFDLYGEMSSETTFTTYFDTLEGVTSKRYMTAYSFERYTWTKIDGCTYEAEVYNTVDKKWTVTNAKITSNIHYHLPTIPEDISKDMNLQVTEKSLCRYTATWKAVEGASKYIVQTRTGGVNGEWFDHTVTTSTSAEFMFAPSTTYEIRVIAHNGSIRFRAVKGELKTDYVTIVNVPGTWSKVVEITTGNAPAVANGQNITDKTAKTIYTLKAIQAINNTKNDMTIRKFYREDTVEPEVTDYNLLGFFGKEDLENELREHEVYEGTVNGKFFANAKTTNKISGETVNLNGYSVKNYIQPTYTLAYLHNAIDVNSIDSRIRSVNYSKAANGVETITVVIAQENVAGDNAAPVHKGMVGDYSGLSGADGIDKIDVKVGDSTITAVINANGTLNSLSIYDPSTIYMETKITAITTVKLGVKCHSSSNYTFTR